MTNMNDLEFWRQLFQLFNLEARSVEFLELTEIVFGTFAPNPVQIAQSFFHENWTLWYIFLTLVFVNSLVVLFVF